MGRANGFVGFLGRLRLRGKLAAVMKAGIRKKVFRDLDPRSLAVAFDGLARAMFLCCVKDPKKNSYETSVPVILDLFLRGGLAKRTGRLPYAS